MLLWNVKERIEFNENHATLPWCIEAIHGSLCYMNCQQFTADIAQLFTQNIEF